MGYDDFWTQRKEISNDAVARNKAMAVFRGWEIIAVTICFVAGYLFGMLINNIRDM